MNHEPSKYVQPKISIRSHCKICKWQEDNNLLRKCPAHDKREVSGIHKKCKTNEHKSFGETIFGLKQTIPFDWNIDTNFIEALSRHVYIPQQFFKMFNVLPYESIRLVIIGQDPYPDEQNACGIAFQVPDNAPICPKSLSILFKELEDDIGVPNLDMRTCINYWISQGVFLTNRALTIGKGETQYLRDHSEFWKKFTIQFIRKVSLLNCPIIFLGSEAWEFKKYCTHNKILKLPHPASRNDDFSGCKMFSKINAMMDTPINWI